MEAYVSEVKRLGEQAKSAAQLASLTVSHYKKKHYAQQKL